MTRHLRTRFLERTPLLLVLASIGLAVTLPLLLVVLCLLDRSAMQERWGDFFWPALGLALGLALASARIGWSTVCAFRRGLDPKVGGGTIRLLFCLSVSGVVSTLWLGQPYHRLVALFHVSVSLGLFALLFGLRRPLLRRLPARPLRLADIVFLNLCLLLVTAEVGLRAFARWRPSPLFARATADAEDWIRQYRAEPGTLRTGFPHNSEGYYDEEFVPGTAERPVLVVIGDSFSVGVVPHAFHYTTVAERELDSCSLQNRGVVSIGPAEYLQILWNEVHSQRPTAIVISLFVGNDLHDSYRFKPPPSLFRTCFDRGFVLTCEVTRRLVILSRERARSGDPDALSGNSGMEGQLWTSQAELIEKLPHLADPHLERASFSEPAFFEIEIDRARGVCGSSEFFYGRIFKVLEEIVRAAKAVPLCIMLIPDEFQVEDALWQELLDSGKADGLERDRPQRELAAWCAEHGIPCLDLLPALRETPPMEDGRVHLYHLRDTHFNARGNERVGRLLAGFLIENGWARPK